MHMQLFCRNAGLKAARYNSRDANGAIDAVIAASLNGFADMRWLYAADKCCAARHPYLWTALKVCSLTSINSVTNMTRPA